MAGHFSVLLYKENTFAWGGGGGDGGNLLVGEVKKKKWEGLCLWHFFGASKTWARGALCLAENIIGFEVQGGPGPSVGGLNWSA